jgi:hypothetical protein
MFREYRIFVAAKPTRTSTTSPVFTGEEQLIIGSDYGHQDPSEERQLVAAMRAREDIPAALTDKILVRQSEAVLSAAVTYVALSLSLTRIFAA